MKKITDKKLLEVLKKIGIQFSWLSDKEYIMPKMDELKALLKDTGVAALKFLDNIQDCDDFALHLNSEIKRIRGSWAATGKILAPESLPWAVGECFGTKFDGAEKQHNANIAVCEEGIFLIEPQTNKIWPMDINSNTILMVRM